MKILRLTQETSELQFSLDELLILKNSLLEVYQQFTVNDFMALIRGISKDEALQLTAYLELALTSAISDTNLKKFALLLFNSQRNPSFEIQVLSKDIESQEQGNLRMRFRLYFGIQKNNIDNEYIEFEDTASLSVFFTFVSSARAFLAELPTKK